MDSRGQLRVEEDMMADFVLFLETRGCGLVGLGEVRRMLYDDGMVKKNRILNIDLMTRICNRKLSPHSVMPRDS